MSESRKVSPSRSYRSLIGVAAVSLLGLLATAGVKSYRDLKTALDLEQRLGRQITESGDRIRVLRDHVRGIEEDPLTLERLAREELGLVKPGDVVIVLPEGSDDGLSPAEARQTESSDGMP